MSEGKKDMKIKSLLLLGLSVGILGFIQPEVAQASSPWINITDKSVPRTDFVDISSHNGIPSVQEFKIMKSYGVKGVMIKLTEATSYRNEYAANQIANAKAAGLRVGGYHYSWYANPAQARIEGQYFAQFAKELGLAKNTPMADDLEEPSMISANMYGQVNANVKAFRAGVASKGYTNNILYTYASYSTQTNLSEAAFGKRKVWMASYPFTPSKDYLWHTDVGMWQFNSNMHFPGVNGTFDANIDYAGVMSPAKKKAVKKVKPTAVNKYMKFNQTGRKDGLYLNAPYSYNGAKRVGTATHGVKVQVTQQEKASNGIIWYYGKVNGQFVWFDSRGVVDTPKPLPLLKTVTSNQLSRKDAMYINGIRGEKNAKYAGRMPHNVKIKVYNQKKDSKNVLWYYGKVNGKYVWFNARATLTPVTLKTKPVNKMYMANQARRKDGLYLNTPYGYRDSKRVENMPKKRSIFVEKQFTDRQKRVWYYGKVNGKYVWFYSRSVVLKPAPKNVVKRTVVKKPAPKKAVKQTAVIKPAPKKVVAKKPAPKKVVTKKPAPKKATAMLPTEADQNAQQLNVDFVFDQTKRQDDLYLNSPRDEAGSEVLRPAVDKEVVHVTAQFVAEDGTIWYNTEIDGESVWFEVAAGRIQV